MKTNKWVDGKQQDMWPNITDHIGWAVQTAGPIDLDLEQSTPMYNTGSLRTLPTGFPMILKHVTKDGFAFTYHHDNGVMRFPVELLVPWRR